MGEFDAEKRERLASVFSGVAHPYRIAVLSGLAAGESLPDVAEEVGTTRGTLQHHVETLIDAELVYRSEGGDFAATPLGEYVLAVLRRSGQDIAEVLDILEEGREKVEQELEPARDVLDESEWERKLHTRKWEQVKDELEESLEE